MYCGSTYNYMTIVITCHRAQSIYVYTLYHTTVYMYMYLLGECTYNYINVCVRAQMQVCTYEAKQGGSSLFTSTRTWQVTVNMWEYKSQCVPTSWLPWYVWEVTSPQAWLARFISAHSVGCGGRGRGWGGVREGLMQGREWELAHKHTITSASGQLTLSTTCTC